MVTELEGRAAREMRRRPLVELQLFGVDESVARS